MLMAEKQDHVHARTALTLSLRYKIARAKVYVETGLYMANLPYRMAIIGIGVRVFWPTAPWWAVIGASCFLIPLCYAVGWAHNRHGWMKQEGEVGTIEQMSWMSYVDRVHDLYVYEALQHLLWHSPAPFMIPDYDRVPGEMPEKIRKVMKSYRKGVNP